MTTNTKNTPDYRDGKFIWDDKNPHGYGNRMGRYRTKVECEFMARHLGPAPLRVLDVGGGSGRLGTFFHALGHRVTVMDHNADAVALAKAKGFERAEVCDLMKYDGRDFDVVACMEVIEYFKDCAPVLEKCAEFTKPGGLVLFCIINARSWRFKLGRIKHSDFRANGFTPAEVEQATQTAGLEIIERRGFQWSLAPTGSDSRTIPVWTALEKCLGLHRWLGQSPWLLYAARRGVNRLWLVGAGLLTHGLPCLSEMRA